MENLLKDDLKGKQGLTAMRAYCTARGQCGRVQYADILEKIPQRVGRCMPARRAIAMR